MGLTPASALILVAIVVGVALYSALTITTFHQVMYCLHRHRRICTRRRHLALALRCALVLALPFAVAFLAPLAPLSTLPLAH